MRKYSLIAVLFCISLFSCAKPQENNDVSSIKGDYIDRAETFNELSGWKFRCKVYAEKQTVADNGGEEEFIKKVDKLLADASKYFCTPGINDAGGNQMHFFMTDFYVFEGASGKFTMDADAEGETEYDLRLVLNEHALSSDDANGWYAAPYLSVGLTHKDGVFSSMAVKLLVKHLAASRGAYDLSALEVLNESGNRINGTTYTAPKCRMNDPYSATSWSEYAMAVINASGADRIGKAHYELLPKGVKATVKNADGSTVKGAKLKFYPVYPGSGKVTETALYEGELSVTGNYIFKNNPFVVPGQADQANNIVNYLVEIFADNVKGFTWMPLHEVTLQYQKAGAGNSFVYTIQMPDASEGEVIPDGDYIDRAKELAKLPGWVFRCKIMGESQTVEDCGGRIPFMKKVDVLLAEASKYFQVPGINDEGDNQVHFFMTDMVIFEGLSKEQMYDRSGASDSSYDLRIIFNAHAKDDESDGDVSGGYLGSPYLCIGHDWPGDGGLWEGYGIDCLVHEMGHYRGMIDIYACELKAADNPINGQGYEGDYSIMNYHYGNKHWCEYSIAVINASAGDKVAVSNESTMPSKVEIKVLDKNGKVANGAYVNCYPVYSYSYKVASEPIYTGTISDGEPYVMTANPFNKSKRVDNYLVEVYYNGAKHYEWMPLYKAMTYVVKNGYTKTYPFTIQLK